MRRGRASRRRIRAEQAGDDTGGAVEIAAMRDGIEMRAAGDRLQRRILSGEGDDQVGGRVAFGDQAMRPGGVLR